MDRFQVLTAAGEPGIRTDSRMEAETIAAGWGTRVLELNTQGSWT